MRHLLRQAIERRVMRGAGVDSDGTSEASTATANGAGVTHRRSLLAVVAGLAALVLCLGAATSALAAEEHPYLPSLSHSGLEHACGATVDSEGDLYVASFAEESVTIYSSSGSLLTEFKPAAAAEPCGVAVNSSGDVYVVGKGEEGPRVVAMYEPSAYPVTAATTYALDKSAGIEKSGKQSGLIVEESTHPVSGVAVDPATQDVYVAESAHISEYPEDGSATGQPISGTIGEGLGLEFAYGIGVDGSTGDVYAVTYPTVSVLNPTGTAIEATIDGTSNPNFPEGFHELGVNLAVDQANGDVYVQDINGEAEKHGVVDQFSETGAFVSQIGPKFGSPEMEFEEAGEIGIATDNSTAASKGDVYVTSQEHIYAFGPLSSGITEYPLTIKTVGSGTVECSTGGGPAGACAAEYPEGETVTLTAIPAAGYTFEGWSEDCSGAGVCEVTMTGAMSVTATFKLQAGQVTLSIDTSGGTGTGSVECEAEGGPAGPCAASYAEGTSLTLTGVPGAHSSFAGWSGGTGSASACTGTAPCSFTIEEDSSVDAPFSLNTHTLSVTPSGSGSVSASSGAISDCSEGGGTCSGSYGEGAAVTLTATPATHQSVSWTGCTSSSGNTCTVEIGASDTTVTATFTTNTRTLTVDPSGSGTVSADSGAINDCTSSGGVCSGTYNEGETVLLTATPGAHTSVVWSGCTTEPSANECNVEIGASNATVTATFATSSHTLSVTKAGSGTGEVQSTPSGIDCGSICAAIFKEGETITLKAIPAAHSHLAGWGGCTSEPSPTECDVDIGTANATVTATFTANSHTLTVTKAGSGSGTIASAPAGIDCGSECSAAFNEGETITLTATPALHDTVAWTGCTIATGDTCSVEVGASDASVTTTFTPITYTLTVSLAGSGTGSVTSTPAGISCGTSCTASFLQGEAITLTATPAAGSEFVGWSGACTGTGVCQLSLLDAGSTVLAQFRAVEQTTPPVEKTTPSNKITLGSSSSSANGKIATLKLTLPGAGTLKLTGKDLQSIKRTISKAGKLTLKLKLTAAGLKKLKHGKLEIKVKIAYTPTGGTTATKTKTITFKTTSKTHNAKRTKNHKAKADHRAKG